MNRTDSSRKSHPTISSGHRTYRTAICCLVLFLLAGCAATPVGNPNSSPGYTRLYCFAPPNFELRVVASGAGPHNNSLIYLSRDSSLDNTARPEGTPSDWVAYGSGSYSFGEYTYTGDLEQFNVLTEQWDTIDPVSQWSGDNQLFLIQ